MKSTSLLINTGFTGLVILMLAFTLSCSSHDDSGRQKLISPAMTTYEVPKEKMQLWESLKNNALNDYNVCQEHCGYDQVCLDKCEKAYKFRLDNEYKNLIGQ